MPNLSSVVRVTVSRETQPVPQAGFGVPLLFSFNTKPRGITGNSVSYAFDDNYSSVLGTPETAFLNRLFSQTNVPEKCVVGYYNPAETGTAEEKVQKSLQAIQDSDNSFYCVLPLSASGTTPDQLINVASWASGKRLLCILQDTNTASLGTSRSATLGARLKLAGNERTAVFWTGNSTDYINAAVAGQMLPVEPGAQTLNLKSLVNVPVSSLVTTTATGNLATENVNYYVTIGGRNVIISGITETGEFIDVIRDIDWLSSRIQENVFFYLANANKIPYTDEGADILVNACLEVLNEAFTNRVIDAGYTVTRASVLQVPINDRANRRFNDINVNARLAGAIHLVNYNLTVTV